MLGAGIILLRACRLRPSQIAQLYAALLHGVVAGSDLMLTDTASEVDYASTLFTMLELNFGEPTFYERR